MTKEEAIKALRGFIGQLTEGCQEAIKVLIPELRESEDERIRQSIVETIKQCADILDPKNQKRMLAWLEKQKGQKSISAEAVLVKAGLKPYKDGNQWCVLAGDNIQEGICGFGDTIEDALYEFLKEVLDLQKKQQPTEWSPTKEQMVALSWAANGMLDNDSPSTGDIKASLRSLYNGLQSKSIRPAEWSEEDENKLNHILEIVHIASGSEVSVDEKEELESFLKSLRLHSKKEWSEEDKEMFDEALAGVLLAKNRMNDTGCIGLAGRFEKAYKWLKSLPERFNLEPLAKQEQKPTAKLTGWVARDRNEEICVYADYPERDSTGQFWLAFGCMSIDQESFPNIKWEDEPMEVEITIKRR